MSDIPQLTDDKWQEIIKKLALRAAWKFSFYGWSTKEGRHSSAPGGIDPTDIVQEAVSAVLEGKRIYNESAYPSFYAFLRSVVDSLISNLYQKNRRQQTKEVRLVQNDDGDDQRNSIGPGVTALDPAAACATGELYHKVKRLLTEEFPDNKIVMGILECLEAGIDKRGEIAKYLDVDEREIDNTRKRLQRVIEKTLYRYQPEVIK